MMGRRDRRKGDGEAVRRTAVDVERARIAGSIRTLIDLAGWEAASRMVHEELGRIERPEGWIG